MPASFDWSAVPTLAELRQRQPTRQPMRARASAWIRGVSRGAARASGLLVALGALLGCAPRDTAAPRESAAATTSSTERVPNPSGAAESPRQRIAAATTQTSASCLECHREIHAGWADSAHALANRPRAAVPDADPADAVAAGTGGKRQRWVGVEG